MKLRELSKEGIKLVETGEQLKARHAEIIEDLKSQRQEFSVVLELCSEASDDAEVSRWRMQLEQIRTRIQRTELEEQQCAEKINEINEQKVATIARIEELNRAEESNLQKLQKLMRLMHSDNAKAVIADLIARMNQGEETKDKLLRSLGQNTGGKRYSAAGASGGRENPGSVPGKANVYGGDPKRADPPAEPETQTQSYDASEFDDNGKQFRNGKKLLPNVSYTANGYHYKTDKKGRIVSAEGIIQTSDGTYKRSMEPLRDADKEYYDYKPTDVRGHLFAHRFAGSDRIENFLPMDARLNNGAYKAFENDLAFYTAHKKEVYVKIKPVYKFGSRRPSKFRISYSFDNIKNTRVFSNGPRRNRR